MIACVCGGIELILAGVVLWVLRQIGVLSHRPVSNKRQQTE